MNDFLAGKRGFLAGPLLFLAGAAALLVTWLVMEPAALRQAFDNDGASVMELITLPFYGAIIPLVWWKCPFTGSRARRTLLCAAVSCVAFMAMCKQMDWHLDAITALFPDVVGNFRGTPFKMRFLTSASVPVAAKAFALAYFVLFFGVFAALLAYFAKPLITGIFKLHPVAWTIGCLGGAGILVQVFDRLPAWIRHAQGLPKDDTTVTAFSSFCTAFEEGSELLLAAFALLAIIQAHRIYNATKAD